MSKGLRLPLQLAAALAAKWRAQLAPFCEQIEIAGSVRRQTPTVGDLEIVVRPLYDVRQVAGQLSLFDVEPPSERINLLWEHLDRLVDRSMISKESPVVSQRACWGDKQRKFWIALARPVDRAFAVQNVQVDVYLADVYNWGAIFAIRTGSWEYSRALQLAIKQTDYMQRGGYLIVKATGERVDAPTERDYFRLAGVKWTPPDQRTGPDPILKPLKPRGEPGRDLLKAELDGAGVSTPGQRIKALTLWQPWASLIAGQVKEYETRSWATPHRGLLAIHAAKREPTFVYGDLGVTPDDLPEPAPLGVVVCLARLVDCVPSERLCADEGFEGSQEDRLGDFSPGRYGWKLEIVEVYDPPIPARGAQGLWEWQAPARQVVATSGRDLLKAELDAEAAIQARLVQDVIHVRDAPSGWRFDKRYVYIGRANRSTNLSASAWHNPYLIGNGKSRAAVVAQFREYVLRSSDLLKRLSELEGKRLVCWCAPALCHGDALAELVEDRARSSAHE